MGKDVISSSELWEFTKSLIRQASVPIIGLLVVFILVMFFITLVLFSFKYLGFIVSYLGWM